MVENEFLLRRVPKLRRIYVRNDTSNKVEMSQVESNMIDNCYIDSND